MYKQALQWINNGDYSSNPKTLFLQNDLWKTINHPLSLWSAPEHDVKRALTRLLLKDNLLVSHWKEKICLWSVGKSWKQYIYFPLTFLSFEQLIAECFWNDKDDNLNIMFYSRIFGCHNFNFLRWTHFYCTFEWPVSLWKDGEMSSL